MDVVITIAEFKRYMETRGYSEKTLEAYGYGLKRFMEYLEKEHIEDLRKINKKFILDYQKEINHQGGAVETRAIKIRSVKRLFEYLVDRNQLLINPTEGVIAVPGEKRKIGTVLTMEEMNTLLLQPNLSVSSHIRDRAMMEVLYSTAIRSNELLNLHVYDVDLKDKVLFIRKGKGGRQRVVPLGKNACKYLREYIEKVRPRQAKKNPKERKLFLNVSGKEMTWKATRDRIQVYRNQAGIKKRFSLHVFRRTCATHMLQKGADIRYVQKLLGHKYLKTTEVYTKVLPVDVKKVHNKTHPNTGKEDEEDDG